MHKVYLPDFGTAIVLDTEQPLSGATTLTIEARKPDGTTVSWVGAEFETTKIRFVTSAGTLDQDGEWRLQAKAVFPAGTWYGHTVRLTVHKAFR